MMAPSKRLDLATAFTSIAAQTPSPDEVITASPEPGKPVSPDNVVTASLGTGITTSQGNVVQASQGNVETASSDVVESLSHEAGTTTSQDNVVALSRETGKASSRETVKPSSRGTGKPSSRDPVKPTSQDAVITGRRDDGMKLRVRRELPHVSVYAHPDVFDTVKLIAIKQRCKAHDIYIEGLRTVMAKYGYDFDEINRGGG